MSDGVGNIIWYELMSADPLGSKAFYERLLPWQIEVEPSGASDYRMITAPAGNVGGVLTLTEEMTAGGARPCWVTYVHVDDVDASVAEVAAQGGQVLMPAHDMPGVGRFAMVADCNGAPFYVMRPLPTTVDENVPVFAPDREGHVGWNELYASDPAAALGFYDKLFGWEAGDRMPMGPAGDYVFIEHGGTRLGGVMPRTDIPSAWAFYFRVADIHAAKDALTAAGGTLLMGPVQVPGGSHALLAIDPQGAVFGAVGPGPAA